MEELIIFVLLGLMTYLIIQRSVAKIVKTPVWLLWLVLMTPASIWMAWSLAFGPQTPIPPLLMFGPFVLCPLLYWWLVQRGRQQPEGRKQEASSSEKSSELAVDAADRARREAASAGLNLLKPESPKIRPITQEEEKLLRNCFPWGTFYLQNLDYHPQAILCRGKLRANPELAYKTIRENVEQKFGDRFLVIFQEGLPDKPFFALVPNPRAKGQPRETEPLYRPGLAIALLLITLVTATMAGAEFSGLKSEQWQAAPQMLARGLPYSFALIAILGLRELSHYWAALRYKIQVTLPYFIPIPFFIGTLGAFVQMRSPVPHRKALFDVAIVGAIVSLILSVPLFIWGLSLSEVVPLAKPYSIFNFSSLDPRFSLLMGVASKLVLGNKLTENLGINLHPLAIAGYMGLIIAVLNLIPVGQLDGGRIVHAMFGQRQAMVIGQVSRLLILLLGFRQQEFLIGALILLFMPLADEPALNDITELDNRRDFVGLLALTLLVAALLPLPGAIARGWNF